MARPRLIKLLDTGAERKLSLISAGPGFGKTTLLSVWLKNSYKPTAWLSLDQQDSEPSRFLAYLIASLKTIFPDLEAALPTTLQPAQPQSNQTILTQLLNELSAVNDHFILVLDDYHTVDSLVIDEMVTFLLDHQPPQMHLVIATRKDPKISLPRLRVRGHLTEIRAADLRFTPDETDMFLNQVMELELVNKEVTTLENRTEGWIAGLQLAALALRMIPADHNRAETADFIQSFAGSHRYVLDYLIEEVLQRQPKVVQNFLLQTAVLDRLNSSLCAAVVDSDTDEDDLIISGKGSLESLERDNLFVIPLDNQRQWYRYHHLFSDVLRAHLVAEQPHKIPILHQRASAWYAEHDLPIEAVQHALAADDFEQAANLLVEAWQTLDSTFQSTSWLLLVKKLPPHLMQMRPMLAIYYASALLDHGELESSLARIADLEQALLNHSNSSDYPIMVDEKSLATLPSKIALAKAQIASVQHDFSAAIDHAKKALQLISEDNGFERAQITVIFSMAHWANGEIQAAHAAMADWINRMIAIGNIEFAVASGFALADLSIAQGNINEAIKTYQQSLQLAAEHDPQLEKITSHHHLGLAMAYHEQGDQNGSKKHLKIAEALGAESPFIDWSYRWNLAQAHLCESANNFDAALDHLNKAKQLYIQNGVPDIQPIEASKARIYLKQGDLSKAQEWAAERSISADGDLSYLREFENITFARLLIANYKNNVDQDDVMLDASLLEADQFLARLLEVAEAGERWGRIIEILLLQATIHQIRLDLALSLIHI